MAAPNVKLPREIRQGMAGDDVVGHKIALSRARPDLYRWAEFTPVAGEFFMDAVVKWKHSRGLGTARVMGGRAHEVLERTHRQKHPAEWAFDARAIAKCQAYYDKVSITPEERIRQAIVDCAKYWYEHRMSIRYSQFRPFQMGSPLWVPSRWDCSAYVTNCHVAGGAPNPNGRANDGLGYTGTLIDNGRKVLTVDSLKKGDLIFYGSSSGRPGFPGGSPTHVALYAGKVNGIHMVYSMGSYPLGFYRYNYRTINQMRTYDVVR